MIRTANKRAGDLVGKLVEFKGNNTYSEWIDDNYVVFSYGEHWILYLYNKNYNQWYGCNEKESITTSKHMSQLKPSNHIDVMLTQKELQKML